MSSIAAPATASGQRHPLREVLDTEQRARRRRVSLRVVLAIAVVVAILATTLALRARKPPLSEQFRTEVVTRGAVVRTVSATGRVEARASVEVGAPVSGRIATVEVDFNDRVTRGQVLARFDTESLDAQVAQTRASVSAAEAVLQQARVERVRARKELARSERLFALGIEPAQALDELRAAEGVAAASVQSAAAQLDLQRANAEVAQTNRGYAEVTAPIDGVVVSRDIEPGQTVAATFQTPVLFTIAEDLDEMRVVAAIDEADMGEVTTGQVASFTVDAFPDRTFRALVTELRLAPIVVQNVVTYEAVLEVDNAERKLRPGMTASVDVQTAEVKDGLRVPNVAMRFTPPGRQEESHRDAVWLLDDDELKRVHVEPGITDGTVTAVDPRGELHEGDEVIVDLEREDDA
jgi:HlyD family secretion protein